MCSWRLSLFSYGWTVLSDSRKKKPMFSQHFEVKFFTKKRQVNQVKLNMSSQPFHSLSLNQIIKSKRTLGRHAKKKYRGCPND